MAEPTPREFDFVIVGAGSAGCVLANRLARAHTELSILLCEAGPDESVSANIDKADRWFATLGESNWHWPCGDNPPQAGLNGRSVDLHHARVVGGCSSHNASFFVRGSSLDYDRWSTEFGCTGWDWNSMLPFFKSIETFSEGDPATRGLQGELVVQRPTDLTPVARAFVEVCNHAGLPSPADYNDGVHQQGVSAVQFNAQNNTRQSAYRAFVKPLLGKQSNLHLEISSRVRRVVFDEARRAIGVEVQPEVAGADQRPRIIRARCDVILTAGAYETPKLLLLSGIGDKDHLAKVGVSLVADVPGVGLNLSDHLWVLFRQMVGNEPYVPNPSTVDWMQVQAIGALDGTVNKHRPDFQLLCCCRNTTLAGFPLPPEIDKTAERNWSLAVAALSPTSRGTVRLQSANPDKPPLIDSNYLSTEADRIAWRGIAEFCAKICTELAKRFPSAQVIPSPGADDFEHIRSSAITMWHPVGTAKMGPATDMFAVVDPATLCVRGVQGLRVADASIIPVITSGNTNAPVMAVAARAASLIAASRSKSQAPKGAE